MKRPRAGQSDFHEGFSLWLDSEEGQTSLEATDDVFVALEGADIDMEERRIIWPDGDRLTIDQTAQKIHDDTGTDIDSIKSHIIGWLEMGFVPEGLDEEQMEIFEEKIDAWIDDFETGNLKS